MKPITAVDVLRLASRLQRVITLAERATFAAVSLVGGAWLAGRILLEDWTSSAAPRQTLPLDGDRE